MSESLRPAPLGWKARLSINFVTRPVPRFIYYWLPVIVYGILILYISSLDVSFHRPTFTYDDKVYHLVEYGIFAWLWFRALSVGSRGHLRRVILLIMAVMVLFGAVDEWYQSLNPARSSDFFDFIADMLGGAIVITILSLKEELRR